MDCKVFIQTNDRQFLGAQVAAYALRRNSRNNDRFSVELLQAKDFPWLAERSGQDYLRDAERKIWRDDLQSFTPLRFVPPKLMGYAGRAVVIDPDCFVLADIWDLFSRDMGGKALMCRWRPDFKDQPGYRASSVMLLDNARLGHWDAERTFSELFEFKKDYMKWIKLEYEPAASVGLLEPEWNDFDNLTAQTRILHTTHRRTQPWKTGLPIDFEARVRKPKGLARTAVKAIKRWLNNGRQVQEFYRPHPDRNQERLFFTLVRECLEKGVFDEALVRREMAANHLRHDALDLCRRLAA